MKLSILKSKKGFTLVELLTVIAIISVLTAVLSVSFVTVTKRSRDGQRKSNIRQIQSALELYRADNDIYPATNSIGTGSTIPCNTQWASGGIVYMEKLPCDPSGTTTRYYYSSTTPNNTYTLGACLENSGDKERTVQSGGMPACTSATYFIVTNP